MESAIIRLYICCLLCKENSPLKPIIPDEFRIIYIAKRSQLFRVDNDTSAQVEIFVKVRVFQEKYAIFRNMYETQTRPLVPCER